LTNALRGTCLRERVFFVESPAKNLEVL